MPVNKIFLFLLIPLALISCKAQNSMVSLADQKLLLEAQVTRMIKCLNEKDADCLMSLYAPDFRSVSPIMEISSTADLVKRTVKGFDENQYTAEATIEEVSVGQDLGYVVLEYRLFEPDGNNGYSMILQKKRIDIWEFNEKKWQLKRSVFYDPRMF